MVTIPTIDQISGTTVMNKMRSLIHNYIEFGTEVGNSVNYMQEVIDNLPHDITDVYNKASIDSMFDSVYDNFDNYYTKSAIDTKFIDYYTKAEVNNLISTIGSFHAIIVEELPEYGEQGVIYLIQITESGVNKYEEYIWINQWELIGQLSNIDLENYYTKTETDALIYNLDSSKVSGSGNIGSDTKPVKIVNGQAVEVTDTLQKEITVEDLSSLITKNGITSGTVSCYRYGKLVVLTGQSLTITATTGSNIIGNLPQARSMATTTYYDPTTIHNQFIITVGTGSLQKFGPAGSNIWFTIIYLSV